ncbi:MAG: hypothetical protein HC904_11155 [Blastochloris sp.]|nr:hypothetical protein [Blastochloris sp.]
MLGYSLGDAGAFGEVCWQTLTRLLQTDWASLLVGFLTVLIWLFVSGT